MYPQVDSQLVFQVMLARFPEFAALCINEAAARAAVAAAAAPAPEAAAPEREFMLPVDAFAQKPDGTLVATVRPRAAVDPARLDFARLEAHYGRPAVLRPSPDGDGQYEVWLVPAVPRPSPDGDGQHEVCPIPDAKAA